MADKAIISTKKLTAIADAIRGKNNSADTYTPDEMAAAISNIGTDDSSKIINSIIDGSITEISNSEVTAIMNGKFAYSTKLESVNFPNVTELNPAREGSEIGIFHKCTSLKNVQLPKITEVPQKTFYGCASLPAINLPLVTDISYNAFFGCHLLTTVNLPLVTKIGSNVFDYCSSLNALIIGTPDKLCTLISIYTFMDTPIKKGTGYIYVADALVDQYKVATNWSVYANQIKPISEYKEKEN